MEKVYLKIPTLNDVWFKKSIKEDPKTMDYNAGYNLSYEGYNYSDGTIKTDLEDLKINWYPRWINNFPTNYYAYIVESESDNFVGEIYAKLHSDKNAYEIGIVIKGEHRNKGFSIPAIKLLINELQKLGVKKLFHEVPSSRKSAIKADISNGFKIIKDDIKSDYTKFESVEYITYLEKEL
ncbi:MAG: GNAT family N-acetyltransferase [Clostridia bacterium]|nr:GNAT family N-acetyltransferase [Clostridia bacterium]